MIKGFKIFTNVMLFRKKQKTALLSWLFVLAPWCIWSTTPLYYVAIVWLAVVWLMCVLTLAGALFIMFGPKGTEKIDRTINKHTLIAHNFLTLTVAISAAMAGFHVMACMVLVPDLLGYYILEPKDDK